VSRASTGGRPVSGLVGRRPSINRPQAGNIGDGIEDGTKTVYESQSIYLSGESEKRNMALRRLALPRSG